MLNSKVSKGSEVFTKFIERKESVKSYIEKTQLIRVSYSFFTKNENKKELKEILQKLVELNDEYELNYFFEESVAYYKEKLIAQETKVKIEMLFRRKTKSNKKLFLNISKDVIFLENVLKKYVERKYPQEFSIRCCFLIFDLESYYNFIKSYLEDNDYFALYSFQNKFIKGVVNYNYVINMVHNMIIFEGYSGNIKNIGIVQAFYDVANYLIMINDKLIAKIKE